MRVKKYWAIEGKRGLAWVLIRYLGTRKQARCCKKQWTEYRMKYKNKQYSHEKYRVVRITIEID